VASLSLISSIRAVFPLLPDKTGKRHGSRRHEYLSGTAQALFPVEAAVDLEMVQDFPALINVDDLQRYLTEPQMAGEISQGIQTNLSADLYREIELPDIRLEHPGKRIIRTILDRIFR
jgi:hypothetical protein